jgi:CheY-like chemotaxis protein
MDVQMPDLDGVGATRQIRALPPPKNRVPIIALTAHAMTGAKEEYLAVGMDDLITKPIEPTLLLQMLVRLSSAAMSAPTMHASPVAAQAERDPGGPVFDPARLEALAGFLAPEQLRDFARLCLENCVDCASRIATLSAAGDCGGMGREAHQLVGPAGNAGAVEVCRLAQALAAAGKAGDEAACQTLAMRLSPAMERATSELLAWLVDRHPGAAAMPEPATAGR